MFIDIKVASIADKTFLQLAECRYQRSNAHYKSGLPRSGKASTAYNACVKRARKFVSLFCVAMEV